jgi:hypothetical protein
LRSGQGAAVGTRHPLICDTEVRGWDRWTEIVTAWVARGPGACTATVDDVVRLTFTSATLASSKTYTDLCALSSEFNGATTYTTGSASIACIRGSTQTVCQAVINIDTGIATTAAQPAVDAIDLTVTGS